MSESGKAVFLSYASQDAEAARRICDALRAAGVEVWFDQSELRGGDAWDAKIRKQIKECALFVPVISANTNARPEGYFRLEWKLAVDRSHLLADDHPFLFPVVIDDTPDAMARVPEKFRDVQWTRLNVKDTPETLAVRVGKLLGSSMETGRPRPAGRGESAASPRKRRPGWERYLWIGVGLVFAFVYALRPAWQAGRHADAKPVPAAPAEIAASPSEARQLAAKARELFFYTLDATKDDFALAEDMMKQAVAKAPGDAEVWAAYAQLHERYLARGWDISDERREAARVATQRALRLDPQSFEARLAAAMTYNGLAKENAESERALRALLQERPDDKRVLRALGSALRYIGNHDAEVIQLYDRSAQLPGGDPLALYNKALALWFAGRAKEADAAIAASLAQQPFIGARLLEAFLALSVDGDLDRAQSVVAQLPSSALLEDRGCFFAYLVYRYRDEPERALATVQAFSRDWINDNWFRGPRSRLAGDALAQAGRPEAAAVEWRAALKVVDQRLAANPNDLVSLGNRVILLAQLGEAEAARQLLPTVRQMLQVDKAGGLAPQWFTEACLLTGDRTEALRLIGTALQSPRHAVFFTASDLRHDPTWKSLRGDPEFTRLIAEADRAEQRDAAAPTAGAAAAPVNIEEKSVAVLAFDNLSDDKANEYFSDGISEELLNVLAKIPGLKVTARTSAFYFKGKNVPIAEVARQLGVAYVVEGSVRKAGAKVRIAAQLIKAADGFEVWSDHFDRELTDVFAVQDEIAGVIARNFQLKLGEAPRADRPVNPEAHQLYLQGRYFLNQFSVESAARAAGLLQRSTELDPSFAPAWAALSFTGIMRGGYGSTRQDVEEGYDLARRAAEHALVLDPDLAGAYVALASVQSNHDFNWKGAAESLRRAQALEPTNADVIDGLAYLAYTVGQLDRAVALDARAVALDPVNTSVRVDYGFSLCAVRRFPEAEAEFRRTIELNPAALWGHAGLSFNFTVQDRYDEAAAEAVKETNEWSRLFTLALAQWGQKKVSESDANLAKLIKTYGDVAAYQVAEAYAFRRDNDRAFEWLERAYRQRDSGLSWLRPDPLLGELRKDPRWNPFLRKLGLADDQLP
jgi:TolB-like protein/Tfp pilus assembly protein PilF